MVRVVRYVLVGCMLLVGACGTVGVGVPTPEPAALSSIVPDFAPGDLEMAVTPTPVEAQLEATLVPVRGGDVQGLESSFDQARVELEGILGSGSDARVLLGSAERNEEVAKFLRQTGIPVDWDWLGREGYHLEIRRHGGRLVILIAANHRAGVLWGVQTLRQLVWRDGDLAWVRLGTVRDRPAFANRGSKQPQTWEGSFKANFSWQESPKADMRRRGRSRFVPTYSTGPRLDASEASVRRTTKFFREWSLRGSRAFAIRFADLDFILDRDRGTDETFEGEYARAMAHYVRRVREEIRSFDRSALLFWLPQTYHENHPRLVQYARALSLAGGLPPDVGLVVSGPSVVSDRIPAESVARMRELFGLTKTPALIFDGVRDHDFSAVRDRDPALVEQAAGVFGDRGSRVNRITRLDWSWNPAAYDPERSLALAVRELAGPSAFEPAMRLVRALGDGTVRKTKERGAELRRLLTEVEKVWGDPTWRPELERGKFLADLRREVKAAEEAK
jgi:hypothetical protein